MPPARKLIITNTLQNSLRILESYEYVFKKKLCINRKVPKNAFAIYCHLKYIFFIYYVSKFFYTHYNHNNV